MQWKKLSILLIVSLFGVDVLAQSIRGKVLDSSGQTAPFVSVALLKSDSTLVNSALTDSSGIYYFYHVKEGNYFIRVGSLEYATTQSRTFRVDTLNPLDLPNIFLLPKSHILSEISVIATAKTIEIKNGNIIVNVANSAMAKGNTVLDLLSKLPGVSIDNDVIMLNGKSGVMVMLDGRPQMLTNTQLVNLLRSMSADLVEVVELLKNPPSKYSASGTSGIISIKTKKVRLEGISGTAFGAFSQGFYYRSSVGTSLNYKLKKILFFSSIDGNSGLFRTKEVSERNFTLPLPSRFEGTTIDKTISNGLNYKVGTEISVSRKSTLGFKIEGGPGSSESQTGGLTTVEGYNNLGYVNIASTVQNPDRWVITNYNLNGEHRFDSLGSSISFSSDYTTLSESTTSEIGNHFFDSKNTECSSPYAFKGTNNSSSRIASGQLDFLKHVRSTLDLEAGVRYSNIKTSNDYIFQIKDSTGEYQVDTFLSNRYYYSERNYAAYVNYTQSFQKLNVQIGVRAEKTDLISNNPDKSFSLNKSYFNLFPNISLQYALSANNNIQLNFNRRIDRPVYNNLNPFRIYRSQYMFFQGNPFLLPHYSSDFELTYVYKESFTNSIAYSLINHVMLQYTVQNDSTRVTMTTIKNMRLKSSYIYSFFYRKNIRNWLEVSTSGLFSYLEYQGDINGVPFKTTGVNYYAYFTQKIIVNPKMNIEVVTFYKGPNVYGIQRIDPRWMLSLYLKRSMLNGTLDCTLGINDIFYTFIGRGSTKFENQNSNMIQYNDTRRASIALNYNFGKLKSKRRSRSNQPELDRLNH